MNSSSDGTHSSPQEKNKLLDCIIVMPAYNESGCIESVVKDWIKKGRDLFSSSFKIIVVNDGSKDNTGAILDRVATECQELQVIHQVNQGHGAALLHAYRAAAQLNPNYVFHVDSDDQFVTSDLNILWSRRQGSRFILGNRIERHDAFHRLVITAILRAILFIVFGTYIRDSNIPFRLIKGSYLKHLLDLLPGEVFAPNIFLSVIAAKQGENLMAIPVQHASRKTGTVSILKFKLIKVCFQSLKELLAFRMNIAEWKVRSSES